LQEATENAYSCNQDEVVETPTSKPSLKRSSNSANSSDNVRMEDGDASANKPAKFVCVKIESVE